MVKTRTALLLLASVLAGCSLNPTYTRPDAPVAAVYPGGNSSTSATPVAALGWRTFFPDARLQALITQALANNRDLRQAALAIEAARAQYAIQQADQLPNVDLQSSTTRSYTPATLSSNGQGWGSNYQVGLGFTAFELDFFGRVRSLSDAALAQYLATEEAERAAHISLVAAVANAYLTEQAATEQLALARQTLAAREASYQLAQQRFDAGAASALDLRQAETLVEAAKVSTATLTRTQAQANNALTLLVGAPLGTLPDGVALAEQGLIRDIPAGLPADLLTQRPDIRAAEQRLIAANAEIGAARAAFFPRITLTGSGGSASADLNHLFSGGSGVWSFMPQLTLPIFDAGRNQANLQLAEVRKEQAVVDYEQTIQTAFREVADALVARDALDEQVNAQERLKTAQAERLTLAEQRYHSGVASYLDVLDAQRELFDAEQALVSARQLRLSNTIDLYRALGGGLREAS